MISTVMLVLALLLFLLKSLGITHQKVDSGWLGLFFWVFSLLVGRL